MARASAWASCLRARLDHSGEIRGCSRARHGDHQRRRPNKWLRPASTPATTNISRYEPNIAATPLNAVVTAPKGAQPALARPRSTTSRTISTYGIRDTPGASPVGPLGRPSSARGAIAFASSLSRNRAPTRMKRIFFRSQGRSMTLSAEVSVRRHQESGQRSAVKDEGRPPELPDTLEGCQV
jgi:hypothetical protein